MTNTTDKFLKIKRADYMKVNLLKQKDSMSYIQWLSFRMAKVIYTYFFKGQNTMSVLADGITKKDEVRKAINVAIKNIQKDFNLRNTLAPWFQLLDATFVQRELERQGLFDDRVITNPTANDVANAMIILFITGTAQIRIDKADVEFNVVDEIFSIPVVQQQDLMRQIVANISDNTLEVPASFSSAADILSQRSRLFQLPFEFSENVFNVLTQAERIFKKLTSDHFVILPFSVRNQDNSIRRAVLNTTQGHNLTSAELETIVNHGLEFMYADLLEEYIGLIPEEIKSIKNRAVALHKFLHDLSIKITDLRMDPATTKLILDFVKTLPVEQRSNDFTSSEESIFIEAIITLLMERGTEGSDWLTLVAESIQSLTSLSMALEEEMEIANRQATFYTIREQSDIIKEVLNFNHSLKDTDYISMDMLPVDTVEKLLIGMNAVIERLEITEDSETRRKQIFQIVNNEMKLDITKANSTTYDHVYNFMRTNSVASASGVLALRHSSTAKNSSINLFGDKVSSFSSDLLSMLHKALTIEYQADVPERKDDREVKKDLEILLALDNVINNRYTLRHEMIIPEQLYLNVENLKLYREVMINREFNISANASDLYVTGPENEFGVFPAYYKYSASLPKGIYKSRIFSDIRKSSFDSVSLNIFKPTRTVLTRATENLNVKFQFDTPFDIAYDTNLMDLSNSIHTKIGPNRLRLLELSDDELQSRLNFRRKLKAAVDLIVEETWFTRRWDIIEFMRKILSIMSTVTLGNTRLELDLKELLNLIEIGSAQSAPKYMQPKLLLHDLVLLILRELYGEPMTLMNYEPSDFYYHGVTERLDEYRTMIELVSNDNPLKSDDFDSIAKVLFDAIDKLWVELDSDARITRVHEIVEAHKAESVLDDEVVPKDRD